MRDPVEAVLDDFVSGLREALGPDLRSVVLFGSAAEGRLRATSDVNVIVVLRRFDAAAAARIADGVRIALAAGRVQPLFLLDEEIAEAAEDFAEKFSGVLRRRRVLWGDDPFAALAIPRDVELRRLRQVLLNLTLRLRQRAVVTPDAEVARVLADTAGPLRGAAASFLILAGEPALPPREALAKLAPSLATGGEGALEWMSAAREGGPVPREAARTSLWSVVEMTRALHGRVAALAEGVR